MINGSKVILREKNPADAWEDYAWEADPELAQLDAARVITIPYTQYLLEYTRELEISRNSSRRFSVDTLGGKHIGNCSYYNLDRYRSEVELGIMIGDRGYWNKGYGTEVVTALVNHIFQELNVSRIYLKTLESNARAQKCFQKCGFASYGQRARDSYKFTFMEITRDQWEKEQTGS